MDVAKAVSYFAINDKNIQDCYGVGKLTHKRMPLIQIPTTAGTGSEVTNIAIFTLENEQKMPFGGLCRLKGLLRTLGGEARSARERPEER